jgi:hypothetical protein
MGIPLIEQAKISSGCWFRSSTLKRNSGKNVQKRPCTQIDRSLYRQFGEAWWRAQSASTFGEKVGKSFEAFAAGDALDYEVVKQTTDTFELNVTGCRYAKNSTRARRTRARFPARLQCRLPVRGGVRKRGGAHPNPDHHAGSRPLRLSLQAQACAR